MVNFAVYEMLHASCEELKGYDCTLQHGGQTPPPFHMNDANSESRMNTGSVYDDAWNVESCSGRVSSGTEDNGPNFLPARLPTFHASEQGPWCSVLCYDACVRLCLNSWAKGCREEAPYFLDNECTVLREAFGIQNVLLQSEEELLAKRKSKLVSEEAAPNPKKISRQIKVEVRKVKIGVEQPAGCNFSYLNLSVVKFEPFRHKLICASSSVLSGLKAARRVRVTPHVSPDGNLLSLTTGYLQASTQYIKRVSRVFKNGMANTKRIPSSREAVQESYTCLLRLKSTSDEDIIRVQPGSGEAHVFFPGNQTDDLIIEVEDSKRQYCGRALVQVAAISDEPGDKIRWLGLYHEPDHELIGRAQLYIKYFNTLDENNARKYDGVSETFAYDLVLEVAMKAQNFCQRNLTLSDKWKWLVDEFSSYYGVSDVYAKLRYLTYVMDVATPTKDCLDIVCAVLLPLLREGSRTTLSKQENRLLGEIEDEVQQILSIVFENYKSLDESTLSGIINVFSRATGFAAPALTPAVKLYTLFHDVSTSEVQLKLCKYFQAAARKRSKQHLSDTDEITNISGLSANDSEFLKCSYQKMVSLVANIKHEICTDIQINDQHELPSFVDLPNLCAPIYCMDLSARLRSFLASFPPPGPTLPVVELVVATADFEKDLRLWNINPIKGGIDAKVLFHNYIHFWIQEKRSSLLEACKMEKVRRPDVTTSFVDDMYEQLKNTVNEYDVIICRWPEYTVELEMAVSDVEKAIIEALDRQYADVLSPLREIVAPKLFGLKYVQKLAMRSGEIYLLPEELGILLNSLKKMMDIQRPEIENQLKLWTSSNPDGVKGAGGEHSSEIPAILRSKFRNYLQAISVKLMENTKLQDATKLKKIIEDPKESTESQVEERIKPLRELLLRTFDHVHSVVEFFVFISICRGLWDRMGEEILRLLQVKKENRTWYRSARIALAMLDDLFASEMQNRMRSTMHDKDLEPPRSILEARSILGEHSSNYHGYP